MWVTRRVWDFHDNQTERLETAVALIVEPVLLHARVPSGQVVRSAWICLGRWRLAEIVFIGAQMLIRVESLYLSQCVLI